MRDQFVVLAANVGVIMAQAAVVVLARVVEAARDRRPGGGARRIERAYLASRGARRKRGEQTGGRVHWTDPATRPDLAGNATRWAASAPWAR